MEKPPQLVIRRDGLSDLPKATLEFGYLIRTYRPGDAELWRPLVDGCAGDDWTVERFEAEFLSEARFDPKGLFFITFGSRPAGTACAWRAASGPDHTGFIRAFAVSREHRGRGLERYLAVKVLEYFRDRGLQSCKLLCDDGCEDAIRCCLSLGFRPEYTHGSHPARWEAILRKLDAHAP